MSNIHLSRRPIANAIRVSAIVAGLMIAWLIAALLAVLIVGWTFWVSVGYAALLLVGVAALWLVIYVIEHVVSAASDKLRQWEENGR